MLQFITYFNIKSLSLRSTLYKETYPWKTYGTTHGYYRNTKTGENCGQIVELYEGDEDCYELVDN